MSTFAAVISWDDLASDPEATSGWAKALTPWKGDDVRVATCPGATLGISLLMADERRRRDRQPFIDDRKRIALVADCRLDERERLCADLSLATDTTDAELLVAGYLRWGSDLVEHLVGDFSCVLWDWGERRCLAFRDPLGIKPLFYSRLPGGLAVASDTELLLTLAPLRREPDDQMVVEFLLWEYASSDRTFWSAVSRLPGGHLISAGPSDNKPAQRYWKPPSRTRSFRTSADVFEEFRHAFFRSVGRRLDAGPVLAHLSGGIDSSLIVCAAAQLQAKRAPGEIHLETISERFPGRSWDEGEFIQAVTDWTGVPRTDWDGNATDFTDLIRPSLAGPAMQTYRSSGNDGDLELATLRSARTILSGDGGDQIGAPSGVEDDLARKHPIAFAIETFAGPDLSPNARIAKARRFARQFAPLSVRRAVATRRYRRNMPDWLDTRWRDLAGAIVSTFYPTRLEGTFEHSVQRTHWHELMSGRIAMTLDLQQRVGARRGVEFRYPFLDQDLVQLAVSIGPEHWPRESSGARIHRDAMGDILPPQIRERRSKGAFSPAVGQRLRKGADQLAALFHSGDWFSAKYVRRREAQSLLSWALASDDWRRLWPAWHELRAIATLEAWLRFVFGYATPGAEVVHERSTR